MPPRLPRLPGLGSWSEDPLWASFYDWSVEHPSVGGVLWQAGLGSDLTRLYAAASEIGRLRSCLSQDGLGDVTISRSGAIVYFRGVRP